MEIFFLPTRNGNSDTLADLTKMLIKEHKDTLVIQLRTAIKNLEKYGFDINTRVKKDTIKSFGDCLYELRVKEVRMFFYYDGKKIIIMMHGFQKRTQKTPESEINKARDEIKRIKQMEEMRHGKYKK